MRRLALPTLAVIVGCAPKPTESTTPATIVQVDPPAAPSQEALPQDAPGDMPAESPDAICLRLTQGATDDDQRVQVIVRKDHPTCFGSRAVDDHDGLARAAREAAGRGLTEAMLQVEADVTHARVVEVMDVLRTAGIDELSFIPAKD